MVLMGIHPKIQQEIFQWFDNKPVVLDVEYVKTSTMLEK